MYKKENPPPSDGNNGLRVVAILEAASKSLKQDGRQIPVCLPKEKKRARLMEMNFLESRSERKTHADDLRIQDHRTITGRGR